MKSIFKIHEAIEREMVDCFKTDPSTLISALQTIDGVVVNEFKLIQSKDKVNKRLELKLNIQDKLQELHAFSKEGSKPFFVWHIITQQNIGDKHAAS